MSSKKIISPVYITDEKITDTSTKLPNTNVMAKNLMKNNETTINDLFIQESVNNILLNAVQESCSFEQMKWLIKKIKCEMQLYSLIIKIRECTETKKKRHVPV